jgi:SAM-dependent methyltransferase
VDQINLRSLPITSKKVVDILEKHDVWNGKILDLGCGEGYLSAMLGEAFCERGARGLRDQLFACDLFPYEFKYDKISCDRCDFNLPFPYENGFFDAVCSVEVVEHLENYFQFSRELYRILKPGGVAVITTPNILNLNSRLKAFVTGFPILCDPLPLSSDNPQDSHIHPVSYYYLAYSLKKAGFREIRMHTDKIKRSAKLLACFFYPLVKLLEKVIYRRMRMKNEIIFSENRTILSTINTLPMLLGRTLIIELVK